MTSEEEHDHYRRWLAVADLTEPMERARRATEEIERLEQQRDEFSALRTLAIHQLRRDGVSQNAIADGIGHSKANGTRLWRLAPIEQPRHAQVVAKTRRLARRIVAGADE